MKILDFLSEKTLLICPNVYKNKLLEKLSKEEKLLDIKFMTLEEYKKNYLFDYDIHTIYYLIKKYNMKVDNAITLLNNLYYVEDKNYLSSKINYLVDIKRELDNKHLLIYNTLFKELLKNYNIVVDGYGKLDAFSISILKGAQFLEDEPVDKEFRLYHFKTIEEEVEYLFNEITKLLIQGIDINHIYLMNVNSEYYPYLKRFSFYYQIPIEIPSDNNIMGTIMGKKFWNIVNSSDSFQDAYQKLDNFKENKLYSSLVGILNKYVDFDLKEVLDLIEYDLYNTNIPTIRYRNQVRIIDVNSYLVDDNDYVFLVGFNNPLIPSIKSDEDYITDNIKNELTMSLTVDLNKISKANTLNTIRRIQNLQLSYKDQTPFNSYYPSILLDDMKYQEISCEGSYGYSAMYNKAKYTYLLDDYVKYGSYHDDLGKLFHTYGDIDYQTYDNQYTGIPQESLLAYLDNKLTLSYSHIDNYYKCGFKYYLANVLKVDIYEETMDALIGNLFHYVLSLSTRPDFDFEKSYTSFLDGRVFTNQQKFFLTKLKDDLLFIIETLKEHRKITGFNEELYEEKINIELNKSPYVNFKGFIDKIMYREKNGETSVSIIDYKTGNPDINIKNLKFGLSMQLPVYLYLMQNSKLFSNIKFAGFYLQHILNNEIKIDKKKSYLEQKKNNLKLVGYSTSDLERLAFFDSTYESSEMIKGMRVKNDGTLASTSNGLSDDEIMGIVNLVDIKIKEAMNSILNCEFNINPKIKNNVNLSCTFCKFKDVCYKKEKDNVYLKDEEEGDSDAILD